SDVLAPLKRTRGGSIPRGPADPIQLRYTTALGPRGDERARDDWETRKPTRRNTGQTAKALRRSFLPRRSPPSCFVWSSDPSGEGDGRVYEHPLDVTAPLKCPTRPGGTRGPVGPTQLRPTWPGGTRGDERARDVWEARKPAQRSTVQTANRRVPPPR